MKKIFIGIDVSKEKCDATAVSTGKGLTEVEKLDYLVFENRPKGFRSLLSWAKRLEPDVPQEDILFVCETTGAYDRALCDYIYSKGLDIWRESALQILWSKGALQEKDFKPQDFVKGYRINFLPKGTVIKTANGRAVTRSTIDSSITYVKVNS